MTDPDDRPPDRWDYNYEGPLERAWVRVAAITLLIWYRVWGRK